MYKSLHIQNFRCFRDLRIEPLGRVNLVAGKNGVGKTTLLEAIFLLSGPGRPELRFSIRGGRGLEQVVFRSDSLPADLWEDIFRDFDTRQKIRLEATSSGSPVRLTISVSHSDQVEQLQLPLDSTTSDVASTNNHRREHIEYVYARGMETFTATAQLVDGKLEMPPEFVPDLPTVIIKFARRPLKAEEIAGRFSRADERKLTPTILMALQEIEPRLEGISLHYEPPKQPMLLGDIGKSKKVPLNLLGDGLGLLLFMLLTMVDAADGGVLFDEIENGFHFSVMSRVWKALNQFSDELNVQIFATTHSDECIQAAKEAFEEDGALSDFRYHRLDLLENGDIEAVTFDEEAIQGAMQFNMEVR
jgi:predicted ATPase